MLSFQLFQDIKIIVKKPAIDKPWCCNPARMIMLKVLNVHYFSSQFLFSSPEDIEIAWKASERQLCSCSVILQNNDHFQYQLFYKYKHFWFMFM